MASMAFTVNAIRLLKDLNPNLIHAHELLSPTTTAVMAKQLFGIPIVAKVLRGGHLGDVQKLKTRRTGIKRLESMKKHLSAFITISEEIDRELTGVGIPEERRPYIPNGVDTDKFFPVTDHEKRMHRRMLGLQNGPMAIFTGRLSPEKRVDQLINIWPAVRAVHPEANLIICGEGPEGESLKSIAGEGVHFTGRVDNVAPYLKASDLYVLPSATEGLSNALLEGMAVGLGCVVTNVGGASDLILHGENGWLLEPDRPAELKQAIINLFEDDPTRWKMGRAAREKVVTEYSLTLIANQIYRLYRQVLADQPKKEMYWVENLL